MEALNNKDTETDSTASITDAKEVLRSMLDNDELDKKIEQMLLLSGAMFANYLIGTSLLHPPNEYGKMVSGQTNVAAGFRQQANVQAMKNYILHPFKDDSATSKSLSRKAAKSLTKEFLENSGDEGNDEQPLQSSTSQKKRISSMKQQQQQEKRHKASPPKASEKKTSSQTEVQSRSPKQSKRKASIQQLANELEEEEKAPEVKRPKRKQSKK